MRWTRSSNLVGNLVGSLGKLTRLVAGTMRQDEPDVHEPVVVPDSHDEAVLVPADVEDREGFAALRLHTIRMRVSHPDVPQTLPLSHQGDPVPGAKRLFSIGVPFPELPQRLEADHPHLDILSRLDQPVKPL
jgi:hypothetical protein